MVHTFWPSTRNVPSDCRVAFVVSRARSLPTLGSLSNWHQMSSAERILGRYRSFCAGVPNVMIRCAASITWSIGRGARARTISSITVASCCRGVSRVTAVLGRPRPAHVAGGEQVGVPATHGAFGFRVTRYPDAVVPLTGGSPVGDELPHLAAVFADRGVHQPASSARASPRSYPMPRVQFCTVRRR